MKQAIKLNVNGQNRELSASPRDTLIHALRDELGLMGTKRGCDTGGCGCCTVIVDGKATYSCMVFVMTLEGKKITTIEGLIHEGKLDPIQEAFIKANAVQCGYCTCGIIMTAKAFLSKKKSPAEQEIRKAIAGNLCRCTGYQKIVEAIKLASTLQG